MNIWRWFMSWFGCWCKKKQISGEIFLGYGVHEIKIHVPGVPCKVCFDIEDQDCPVCQGDVNKIGIKVCEQGFTIHADIKTNTCLITWHCEYR